MQGKSSDAPPEEEVNTKNGYRYPDCDLIEIWCVFIALQMLKNGLVNKFKIIIIN